MENELNLTKQGFISKSNSNKVVLILLVLILCLSVTILYRLTRTTSTISVTGRAEITAKPDRVSFIVTRVNTGVDASQAIDDGVAGINKLITLVREMGGSDVEIKKTFNQVTPGTNGYTVANAFSVKSKRVNEVDYLIKKLYMGGASTVSNVSFESSDIAGVEQRLRDDVYKDALEKAKRIARSAGKRLGGVVAITDDAGDNSSTVSTSMVENLISVSKSITVVYKIW